MSKWDWIHSGLEIATYVQAQKAQQNLTEMKTASEMEGARRILLEAMKSFVFDISRDIQLAEEQITSSPQQVYIVSKLLDLRFTSSGLSADIFPDFQDKEYVFKTQKKTAEVIRKSKAFLSEEKVKQSDIAVEYIIEMPVIQKAIPVKVTQEFLQESNEKWQELENKNQDKKSSSMKGLVLLAISLFIGFIVMQVSYFLGLSVALIGIAISIFLIASKSTDSFSISEYEQLQHEREELQKQLMPQQEWEEIVSTIGDLTSEQYKEIYVKRLDFLRQILGDEIQKYLTIEK